MNTLADLKHELTLGTKVETLSMSRYIVNLPNAQRRVNVGQIRTVVKVQSGGVWLTEFPEHGTIGGSFMDWEKAGNWAIDGDYFTNIDGRQYRIVREDAEEK